MTDIIIIAIVVILVAFGIRSGMKHFKGEGGCCGKSAPVKRERKKLDHVIATRTVRIEGMTCDHCRNWVERSINEIEGAAAKVDLSKKEAVVSLATEVSDETIRAAVEKAGYKVVEIK